MPVDSITATVRGWGRDNGFRRKGTTLYRDQLETVAVVNLQGSQYGGRYYVNVALWLKAVAEPDDPRENKCHIRTRLTQLVPDATAADALLTGPKDVGGGPAFNDDLRRLLDEWLTPALALTGTLAELQRSRTAFLDRCLVGREALQFVG